MSYMINWDSSEYLVDSTAQGTPNLVLFNGYIYCINNKVYRSSDAINWSSIASSTNISAIEDVTCDSTQLIAINGSGRIGTSSNGTTWQSSIVLDTSVTWKSITYGNGVYIAVGVIDSTSYYSTSSDLVNWSAIQALPNNPVYCVRFYDGTFYAVGGVSSIVYSSDNGATWTTISGGGGSTGILKIRNYLVALPNNTTAYVRIRNIDGNSWESIGNLPANCASSIYDGNLDRIIYAEFQIGSGLACIHIGKFQPVELKAYTDPSVVGTQLYAWTGNSSISQNATFWTNTTNPTTSSHIFDSNGVDRTSEYIDGVDSYFMSASSSSMLLQHADIVSWPISNYGSTGAETYERNSSLDVTVYDNPPTIYTDSVNVERGGYLFNNNSEFIGLTPIEINQNGFKSALYVYSEVWMGLQGYVIMPDTISPDTPPTNNHLVDIERGDYAYQITYSNASTITCSRAYFDNSTNTWSVNSSTITFTRDSTRDQVINGCQCYFWSSSDEDFPRGIFTTTTTI